MAPPGPQSAPAVLVLARIPIGALTCCLVPPAFGLAAVLLDQDANWDLRNYHWYNAYAFLTGRFGVDIAPAHIATFYNPLLDVPFFLLAQAVPARTAGFLLGLVQGLNVVPLYLLARRLLPGLAVPGLAGGGRGLGAAGLALAGLLGGGHLGLIGTTFYDNVLSIAALSALALVLAGCERAGGPRLLRFGMAGLVVGAATGLKLPMAVYALGLGAAVLAAAGPAVGPAWRHRLRDAAVLSAAGLIGLVATGGFWMARLWQAFANPVFPYFNGLFGSPMALPASYRDTRFVPESVAEALMLPLRLAADPRAVGEIDFTDYRLAALYLVGAATLAVWCAGRLAPAPLAERRALAIAATFAAASYAPWLALFAVYRYAVTLEMLAPVLIAACVLAWPISARVKTALAAALVAAVAAAARPGSWGRVPWSAKFVEVAAPAVPEPGRALALIAGFAPVAWVIPSFPPDMTFVRIQGYSNHPDDGAAGLAQAVAARVRGHGGAFYLLAARAELALAGEMLARYGLAADTAACAEVRSNLAATAVDVVVLCPVRRAPRPTPRP
jgi:hypothetical protein